LGAAADLLSSLQTSPARPAADGASSSAARSIRSWPALTAALVLVGLMGRGRARPDRSGVISRSYLPLVSPA
jgi:hypothetical protein